MELQFDYIVREISADDYKYAPDILNAINYSAKKRGTGIEDRPLSYLLKKMDERLGVIAIHRVTGEWLGFCSIEVWEHKKFIANTGLIISPKYRGLGISRAIKFKLFDLCRLRFPLAKIFSLTASPAVINVNLELGYQIKLYEEVVDDPLFLEGGHTFVDFVGLMKKGHTNEHTYLAMVYDPAAVEMAHEFDAKGRLLVVNN